MLEMARKGAGTAKKGDWLRPRCLSPFVLPLFLSLCVLRHNGHGVFLMIAKTGAGTAKKGDKKGRKGTGTAGGASPL